MGASASNTYRKNTIHPSTNATLYPSIFLMNALSVLSGPGPFPSGSTGLLYKQTYGIVGHVVFFSSSFFKMALSGGIKGHSLDTGLCSQGEADWNSVPPAWPPWLRSTARCCNLFHTRLLRREETREKKLGVAAKVQKEHAESSSLSSPSDWLEKPFTWKWNAKNVYIALLLILFVLFSL